MDYSFLAEIYDLLMEDVDYNKWTEYIYIIINKYNAPGNIILDLGCGTGSISKLLAKKGMRIIGIDKSMEMLIQAEQKFREDDLEVSLYQQDIREFAVEDYVDIVISTFDTLNYITDIKELEKVFDKVYEALNNNGLFIFDLNSYYKLSKMLGNKTYTYNTEKLVYIWQNYFNLQNNLCNMELTFFCLDEQSSKYHRYDEIHIQRAYKVKEIINLLKKVGFDNVKTFGELSFDLPKKNEKKIFFVAKKNI